MGPAGAGNLRGVRYRNVPRLDDWLSSEGPSRIVDVERPQPSIARGERFMLGLRLRDGMPRGVVESLLRDDPGRRSMVEDLLEAGRLEWWQEGLRISEESLMTADEVLSRLV